MFLDDLAFWAQAQPSSGHHIGLSPGAGAVTQLAVAVPGLGLIAEHLSPMAVALFQGPPGST